MALEYINKNILTAFSEGEFNVLIHQTNCVSGTNVAGIAKAIFDKYPEAAESHIDSEFSDWEVVNINDKQEIINCNSQYYPGNCSIKLFEYLGFQMPDNFHNRLQALENVLDSIVFNYALDIDKTPSFGIPLIGSGLGADYHLKGVMTDLEYFKKFIAPTVEKYLPNCKVYYL